MTNAFFACGVLPLVVCAADDCIIDIVPCGLNPEPIAPLVAVDRELKVPPACVAGRVGSAELMKFWYERVPPLRSCRGDRRPPSSTSKSRILTPLLLARFI